MTQIKLKCSKCKNEVVVLARDMVLDLEAGTYSYVCSGCGKVVTHGLSDRVTGLLQGAGVMTVEEEIEKLEEGLST